MADSLQAAYALIGVPPDADVAALRAAYRHQAQLHHPDHNGGSPAAARRFAGVQAAYATILEARRKTAAAAPPPHRDGGVEDRLAAMERELREARQAEAVRRAEAARRSPPPPPPTPEELGYVTTDDSVSDIVGDLVRRLRRSAGL